MNAKISSYLIALLVFGMVITGIVVLLSGVTTENADLSEEYEDFNATFNKLEQTSTSVDNLESKLKADDGQNWGVFGVLNALIGSAWETLKLVFSSFSFITAIFAGLHTWLGVPLWVTNTLYSLILVVVIFTIINLITKGEA